MFEAEQWPRRNDGSLCGQAGNDGGTLWIALLVADILPFGSKVTGINADIRMRVSLEKVCLQIAHVAGTL